MNGLKTSLTAAPNNSTTTPLENQTNITPNNWTNRQINTHKEKKHAQPEN